MEEPKIPATAEKDKHSARKSIDGSETKPPGSAANAAREIFKQKNNVLRQSFDSLVINLLKKNQIDGPVKLPDAGIIQSQLRQGPVQQPEQLHPVSVAGDRFRVNIPETVYRTEGMSSAAEVKMFKIDVSKAGASWTVFRRYGQFSKLDSKLKSKGLLSSDDRHLPSRFEEHKKIKLHHYLTYLSSHSEVEQSTYLHNFLYPLQLGDTKPEVKASIVEKDKGLADEVKQMRTIISENQTARLSFDETDEARPKSNAATSHSQLTLSVVGSEKRIERGEEVVYFKIEVVDAEKVSWHIYRRYSAFADLDKKLRQIRALGSNEDDLVDEKGKQRKAKLTSYLRYLVDVPAAEEELTRFLRPNKKYRYKPALSSASSGSSSNSPSSSSSVGTSGQMQYTARLTGKLFEIEVCDAKDEEWVIRRSYAQFFKLDKALKQLGFISDSDAALPHRQARQKKRKLHSYIQYLLKTAQKKGDIPTPLHKFLQPRGSLDKRRKRPDPYVITIDEKELRKVTNPDGTSAMTKFYKLEVAKGDHHWTLWRSYEHFRNLDIELKKNKALNAADMTLPAEESHNKMPKLAMYLETLLQIHDCAHHRALYKFMDTVHDGDSFYH